LSVAHKLLPRQTHLLKLTGSKQGRHAVWSTCHFANQKYKRQTQLDVDLNSGTLFTTFPILCNLRMGSLS